MNIHLEKIKQLLQDVTSTEDKKQILLKAVIEAEKQWAITDFKLDRTEKVKRTTAILLEETIEELEKKRKDVEAQNRNLEIEAAMERVRSRSLAMHHSDELKEVVRIVYEELVHLNIPIHQAGFLLDYKENDDWVMWMADAIQPIPTLVRFQVFDHPLYDLFKNVKDQGLDFATLILGKEEKDKLVKESYKYIQGVPELVKEIVYGYPGYAFTGIYLNTITLFAANFEAIPFSESDNQVLKRFAKVFEQTYTRFLDLQKAEAQTREAQIEVAVERVRAKALAMHNSEEITGVARVLRNELGHLNIEGLFAATIYLEQDDETVRLWDITIADNIIENGPKSNWDRKVRLEELPPQLFIKMIWDSTEKYFVIEQNEQDFPILIEWVNQFNKEEAEEIERTIKENNIKRTWFAGVQLEHGRLSIELVVPPSNEIESILSKIGVAFDLAYKRFLDLQKAEAQTREAQIETALERVRAKTMAMHNSEDMGKCILKMFAELTALGVDEGTRFGVGILNHDNENNQFWTAKKDGQEVKMHIGNLDMTSHPLLKSASKAWKAQVPFHQYVLEGEDLLKYYQMLNTAPDYKIQIPLENLPEKEIQYCFIFEHGFFYAFTPHAFQPDLLHIIQRFSLLFAQTYRRYLDLVKAEAQAREAEIQLALERVRARTMAMHKSNELPEVAFDLFEQMHQLGFAQWGATIAFADEARGGFDIWFSTPESRVFSESHFLPNQGHPVAEKIWNAYKEQIELSTTELKNEEKLEYDQWMFANTPLGNMPENVKAGILSEHYVMFSISAMKYGFLEAMSLVPIPTKLTEILPRFSKVFEQTYTRFLDLQKAEAQAREAQIEASLERVRSKTLAMHNSADVGESVSALFDELVKLGVTTNRCGILIHSDSDFSEVWTAKSTPNEKATLVIGKLEITMHPMLVGQRTSWLNKEPFFSYELTGQDMINYYQAINNSKYYPTQFNLEALPAKEIHSDFHFSEGSVFAFTNEALPTEWANVFKRFTSVFGQTYRRYLDLQKAEARARESQIETSVERVRSQAMAMRSSEDLIRAAEVLRNEVIKLEVDGFTGAGFYMVDENDLVSMWDFSDPGNIGKPDARRAQYDPKKYPVNGEFWRIWKKGTPYFVMEYGPDKLKKALEEWREIDENIYLILKQAMESGQLITQWNATGSLSRGVLSLDLLKPPTEDTKQIVVKMTAAFDLAYQRFEDLRKAEAQTREATIEAALEKVRGKAMAMHTSNDLMSTAGVVFTELKRLGINSFRGGVALIDKESRFAKMYSATSSEEGDTLSLSGTIVLDGHPILSKIWECMMGQSDYFPVLKGELLESYITHVSAAFNSPLIKSNYDEWYGCFLPYSEGGFYVWSDNPFTESEVKILHRFNAIVDLTFRRYLELQRAEANALDALRSASLDRVRAEIASMRTKQDLERITPLIWKELTTLGIPFVRCGVFIMDEQEKLIHTFLSTPDGKAIAAFNLPYGSTPLAGAIEFWREKKIFLTHWGLNEYAEFAEAFIDKNEIEKRANYLNSVPKEGIHLHLLPFMQGMLYVGNTASLTEDNLRLVQSVADAFSTAYARYEDFNKIESAKAQVEKTLSDLKQTQAQLVQSEKMASLGELTAGIAHEIQNPLNFVNNFSEVSAEMIKEIQDERQKTKDERDEEFENDLLKDISENMVKINHHGKRAADIVKGMLQHSRSSSGVKEPTDINALADEYLRLAYHGLRAKDKSFNAKFETAFDDTIGKVNVFPQEFGRVILNLITNAFYAVNERAKSNQSGYEPAISVSTKKEGNKILISVEDNGNGIPPKILDKIFQPFFTTKPTGQGTGLGLSLAYDIVKAHGGTITVNTNDKAEKSAPTKGEGSLFNIIIPIT